MKMIKKFIIKNKKFIIGFIVGVLMSAIGVGAASIVYAANEVGYDNTNVAIQKNGVNVTNIQDAIEVLYDKALVCVNGGSPSVSTFNFTINGTTYTAEEGMTWSDWVESSYNTFGVTIKSGHIYTDSNNFVRPYNSDCSNSDDVITSMSYISNKEPCTGSSSEAIK